MQSRMKSLGCSINNIKMERLEIASIIKDMIARSKKINTRATQFFDSCRRYAKTMRNVFHIRNREVWFYFSFDFGKGFGKRMTTNFADYITEE